MWSTLVTSSWKYPLVKTCVVGALGYFTIGIVDSVDSSPILDDNEEWRNYRSSFYELYFKLTHITGKRHYIEKQYRTDTPSGSYLRCAIDSLEKAHQIVSIDSDQKLRRRVLRKAHRYAIKAVNNEEDDELRAKAYKWYGLILLKRSKYGNKEKRLLKAINLLEKAIIVDRTDPELWFYLGVAKRELGEYQEAIECHTQAVKLKPNDCPRNDYHLGLAHKQLNSPKSRLDACNAFKQVLAKHCDSVADVVVRRAAIDHLRECEKSL